MNSTFLDKKRIVTAYLERGNLLTPEALEKITKNGNMKEKIDALIVDKDMLEDELSCAVVKNFQEKPAEIKKDDFVSFYNSKFEKMKNIIVSRLQKDFVSLNKIGALMNEIYVIGMVREAGQRNGKYVIELEDMTDSKHVIFDKEQEVEIDDVIAVKAVSAGEALFGKAVIHPDIPLRQPSRGTGKGCFVSDLHLDEVPGKEAEKFFLWLRSVDAKNVFVAGDIGDTALFEKFVGEYCQSKTFFCIPGHKSGEMEYPTPPEQFSRKNIIPLSNPSIINVNGLVILMVHDGNINFLKKRYIGHSKLILKEDYLVLDIVPDIMHCGHTHKPESSNYKSVSIVNSGSLLSELRPVVIDFETREVTQAAIF